MYKTEDTSIRAFLDYLKFQKRYSAHTVTSYETDLCDFARFLLEQFGSNNPVSAKSVEIRSWLAGLKANGQSSRTINRKISALKTYFKYHLKSGKIQASPMQTVVAPKQSKRLPVYVEKKDMDTLFDYVEFPDNDEGLTEKLILMTLYQTGIRKSELIGLKEDQVDYCKNVIKVLGKGSKERIIPVGKELLDQVKTYISNKPENADREVVFVNQKGKRISPRKVYDIVHKYLSMVTTVDKRSPHVMRHSFATHLSNNGAELNAVKELLGHSSLAATQVYTHNTIEKLKDIYKKAHPKA